MRDEDVWMTVRPLTSHLARDETAEQAVGAGPQR